MRNRKKELKLLGRAVRVVSPSTVVCLVLWLDESLDESWALGTVSATHSITKY